MCPCQCCPVIAARNGFSCGFPLLPNVEAHTTGSNGCLQFLDVVCGFPKSLLAAVVPAVSIEYEIPDEDIPYAQHQVQFIKDDSTGFNV